MSLAVVEQRPTLLGYDWPRGHDASHHGPCRQIDCSGVDPEKAGIRPGVPLDIQVRGGRIEIEPSPQDVRLIRKGRLTVAVPVEPSSPLTAETVERVMDELRRGE